jgi:hypothetical protein
VGEELLQQLVYFFETLRFPLLIIIPSLLDPYSSTTTECVSALVKQLNITR